MVIEKGKRKSQTTPPPPFLGQNIGEKIYIYTLAKKIPNIWAKLEKLKPPPPLTQIYRARIVLQKFIYIPGQKGWLYLGGIEKT